jgi:hypothetical protein
MSCGHNTREDRAACIECLYSIKAKHGQNEVLECHRYPPQIVIIERNVAALWPSVPPDSGCGEFQSTRAARAQVAREDVAIDG